MPLVYHGDTGAGYVLIAGHGHISLDDWAGAIAAQIEDGRWHEATLLDVSDPLAEVSMVQTAQAIIRCVRELIGERGERGPLALVLVNQAFYAEGRDYLQTFRKALPHRIEVFATRADAIAWLTDASGAPRD